MGVFFRLGDTQLGQTLLRNPLAEHVAQAYRREGAGRIDIGGVFGGGDKRGESGPAAALKAPEILVDKSAGQLPRPVGAEIHKQHGVALGNRGGLANAHGADKLIVFVAGIGGLQAGGGAIRARRGQALGQQAIHRLDAIPALIPVHRKVATAQRGDTAHAEFVETILSRAQGRRGAAWRRVTAVQKSVQVEAFSAALRG